MLDRRSALASARPYVSPVLSIAERPGFTLTQAAALDAAFEAKLAAVVGALPPRVGMAAVNGALTVMRIGPAQFWIVGPEKHDTVAKLAGLCAVTPLSHSRVRIGLAGAPARAVLAKLMPIDFHVDAFGPGAFALTGIHHTPAAVHCTGDHAFDLYVMRTFALNVWEVIADAALEFG
jgi:sarcosine oxidase subunit gamma